MKLRSQTGIIALAVFAAASSAQGYYHFVHYNSTASGYQQVPEKFDLSALVNNTVPYVISQTGPDKLATGDSFASLTSQIHLAARTWSAVPTSQLRLAFGGHVKPGAAAAGPEIEIIFDDLPPGLLGISGPTSKGDPIGPDGARFLPIAKSTMILPRDMSARPSWSEAQFLTITHEMGHALGLQHAQASSVMSTERTRSVTKSMPLAPDDRAGISVLYPTPDFASRFGVITGRVTAGADGINLASVVALTTDGIAITALTNPDGTYRIEGVPQGYYFLYAHPLPPPVSGQVNPDDVTPPSEIGGVAIPASGLFESQFFPGVQTDDAATVLDIKPGVTTDKIDFRVTRRTSLPVYSVTTYSAPGSIYVKPAHLSPTFRNLLIATGVGLTSGGVVAPGLVTSIMGPTAAVNATRPLASDPAFVQIDTQFHPIPGQGPRHMLFRRDGATYVLPAGFHLVAQNPPSVTEWAAVRDDSGAAFVEIRGTGLTNDGRARETRVLFDGVAATLVSALPTALRVIPPPAPAGRRASIVVLNPDGQSSLFLRDQPLPYVYGDSAAASFSVGSAVIAPGVETLVEIRGVGTAFTSSTQASFGSADIIVRRIFVLGPQRLLANVLALPGATPARTTVQVTTGLQELTLPDGFQIGPVPVRAAVSVASEVVDDATGRPAISPGFTARVRLKGVTANLTPASFAVRVAGVVAPAVSFSNSTLVFRMPVGLGSGPATVEISAANEPLPTVAAMVDLPPPVIASTSSGTAARPAAAAELITMRVTGLVEGSETVDVQRLQALVGGGPVKVLQPALVTNPTTGVALGHDIPFELDAKQAAGTFPVVILIDGRPSAPFNIIVR